jgi:hypothetical protein
MSKHTEGLSQSVAVRLGRGEAVADQLTQEERQVAVEEGFRPKRKAISTRTKFEVRKRDGFKCRYCGATPMARLLHVDHVVPVSKGGTNEMENLVTACVDCNLGKAGVPLSDVRKGLGMSPAEAKEHAKQVREYLAAQRELADAKNEVAEEVAHAWEARIGKMTQGMFERLPGLLREWPHERLVEAIDITARNMGEPEGEFNARSAVEQAKYFHGVLRRWREKEPPSAHAPEPQASPRREISEEEAELVEEAARQKEGREADLEHANDAVTEAVQQIRSALNDFPSRESRLEHVAAAFLRAMREPPRKNNAVHPWSNWVEAWGVRLSWEEPEGFIQWKVTPIADFSPQVEAWKKLSRAINHMFHIDYRVEGIEAPLALKKLYVAATLLEARIAETNAEYGADSGYYAHALEGMSQILPDPEAE